MVKTSRVVPSSEYGHSVLGIDRYGDLTEEKLYEYDELDRLVKMRFRTDEDPAGARDKTILWEYDPEGNVTKMTDPEGKVTRYQYFRDNLLHKVIIERNGVDVGEFVYSYDLAGRLDEIQYPASTGITAVFRDSSDTPGSGFDGNGNLRFLRYEKAGLTAPLRSFEWTYDNSNNRQSMLDVDPSRAVLWSYEFDWLDRLVAVKRAEAVDVPSLPAPTLQRSYVFDESDNRKFFDDHVNGVTYHYTYKSVDKQVPIYSQEELRPLILTWIGQNFAQVIEDIEEIIQDDIENATGQTLQELEQLAQENLEDFVDLMEYVADQDIEEIYGDDFQEFDVVTYHSDQLEEILVYATAAGHRILGDFVPLESFLHDAAGNMTRRTLAATGEEISMEWDDFERLRRVESDTNGRMQDARYDLDGLRQRKLDKNGNSSEEYGVGISTAASVPGSGSSNAPSISYISGHMIMAAEIDGQFVFHLGDALSSVRDVVDDTGAVIKSFEFDEYGNLLSSSGTGTTSPKTWIGGLSVNDDRADSGMFNMGHRNYAAGVLGRFISRDPIGHAGNLNLYSYPTNPVSFADPAGLAPGDPASWIWFIDGPGHMFFDAENTGIARPSGQYNCPIGNKNASLSSKQQVFNELLEDAGLNKSAGLRGGGRSRWLKSVPWGGPSTNIVMLGLLFLGSTQLAKADPCDFSNIKGDAIDFGGGLIFGAILSKLPRGGALGLAMMSEPWTAKLGEALGAASVQHEAEIKQFLVDMVVEAGYLSGSDLRPSTLVEPQSNPTFLFQSY